MRARGAGRKGAQRCVDAQHLGTTEYARLRVGVGRGDMRLDLADHVLARFEADERSGIDEAITRAADAVERWLDDGLEKMMSIFNRVDAPT